MNALSVRTLKQISWPTIVMFTLGFWLSGSLVLDLVIIPSLLAAGMMAESGFASAGYLLFSIFNHIELVCGALVLTGCLIFNYNHTIPSNKERWSVFLAVLLLTIAIMYTYIFTPYLSGLGLQLNWFDSTTTMPTAMVYMHGGYWFLEAIKLVSCATLLNWCYRQSCALM